MALSCVVIMFTHKQTSLTFARTMNAQIAFPVHYVDLASEDDVDVVDLASEDDVDVVDLTQSGDEEQEPVPVLLHNNPISSVTFRYEDLEYIFGLSCYSCSSDFSVSEYSPSETHKLPFHVPLVVPDAVPAQIGVQDDMLCDFADQFLVGKNEELMEIFVE